jgi:phage-related protein (TIGR01555 family)
MTNKKQTIKKDKRNDYYKKQTVTVKKDTFNEDGYVDIAKKLGTKTVGNSGFELQLADDQLFAALYVGNGLTKRYVDLLSDDMVRQWFTIPEDTEGKTLNYLKNIKAKSEFKKAIRAAKLFGGAVIFMVIDDGREPNEPVDIKNIKSIRKLKFFSRKNVVIEAENYYGDATDEKFGEPQYFDLYSNGALPTTVHESRCLVFKGEYYPSDELGLELNYEKYWGVSILQSIYEDLQDFGLAQKALAKTLTKFNIDVLKIENLMQLLKTPDGLKQLNARATTFDLAKSISTTLILDSKESFEAISQALTGVADAFTKLQETLTGITGIPFSIFWGKSAGGLNAESKNEVRTYYDRIKSDQEEELVPPAERLIELISYAKDSKLDFDQEYNICLGSLWQQTDEDKVIMRKTQAETDQIYISNGVYDPQEVRESRFGGGNYSIETEVEGEVDLGDFEESEDTKEDPKNNEKK